MNKWLKEREKRKEKESRRDKVRRARIRTALGVHKDYLTMRIMPSLYE